MDSNSIYNPNSLTDGSATEANSNYFDRKQQQEQFEEQQKLEKQKLELQKQELQVQQNQQNTQQLLVVGGLAFGGILVVITLAYLLAKLFKDRKKANR